MDVEIEAGMIMNERWQYCPHVAWNRSAISVSSTYRNEFMNCEKVFMTSPWNYEGVYTGKYAKFFDFCERS